MGQPMWTRLAHINSSTLNYCIFRAWTLVLKNVPYFSLHSNIDKLSAYFIVNIYIFISLFLIWFLNDFMFEFIYIQLFLIWSLVFIVLVILSVLAWEFWLILIFFVLSSLNFDKDLQKHSNAQIKLKVKCFVQMELA